MNSNIDCVYKNRIEIIIKFIYKINNFHLKLPKSSAQDYLQKAGTVSMEYLNIFKTKLTNTVVDTVYMAESITKTVLPGNPVTREYEVGIITKL